MNPDAVFKRYDVRGKYPEELDEEFVERMGKAVGTFAIRNYNGEVTVSRDNKTSSKTLKDYLIKGIISTGADVYDAGQGTTDYAAFTGNKFGTVTVQVTSSHLPLDTNGLKFMYPEGNGFVNEDLNKLEQLFRKGRFEKDEDGTRAPVATASRKKYFEGLKNYVGTKFNGDFNKKIVVDTLGGAATDFLPRALEELGAEVIDVSEDKPEGPYYDPPNPKPDILENTVKRAEEEDADLVLANDMDADRVAVYFNGEWIGGDELFAVYAQLLDGDVVASIDTSRAVEELVEEQGNSIFYTRVGDPFVIDETLERDAILSGEPNGHYCFPEFVAYNSGVLAALIAAKIDLEEALENVPEYFTEKKNIDVEDKHEVMEQVVKKVKNRFDVISDDDGVKYQDGDANILIRSSGSSPVIRVKAESKDKMEARKAAEVAAGMVRNP